LLRGAISSREERTHERDRAMWAPELADLRQRATAPARSPGVAVRLAAERSDWGSDTAAPLQAASGRRRGPGKKAEGREGLVPTP
jgi:hypothetical protein